MKSYFRLLIASLLIAVAGGLLAQDTGQICVSTFEDRNGNGSPEVDEPPVTQGIGLHLLNALGVTIKSTLLETSENASRGLACFDDLPAGDYSITLTSSQYQAATASSFDAAVLPGRAPAVFDFGVSPIPVELQAPAQAPLVLDEKQRFALQGIGIGLIVSAILAAVMLLTGLLVYLRNRRRSRNERVRNMEPQPLPPQPEGAPPANRELSSAGTPAPNPAVNAQPLYAARQGSPLLFDEDETNPMASL